MPDLNKVSANAPDVDTVGGYLKNARLERHLELAQVSDMIKYHASQLRAVEEQNWSALPNGFVLRSIIKKFAVAVGANPDIALEKLAQATGNVAPPANNKYLKSSHNLKVNEKLNEHISSGSGGTWLWILLILAILVAVAYFAFTQGMFNIDDVEFIKKWFNQ